MSRMLEWAEPWAAEGQRGLGKEGPGAGQALQGRWAWAGQRRVEAGLGAPLSLLPFPSQLPPCAGDRVCEEMEAPWGAGGCCVGPGPLLRALGRAQGGGCWGDPGGPQRSQGLLPGQRKFFSTLESADCWWMRQR